MSKEKKINWKTNLIWTWLSQLLTLAGSGATMPFIPIYMREELGIIDEASRGFWVAAFYFASTVGFSVFTPIWGMIADKYGRKLMLLRANFLASILFPCLILSPNVYILVFFRFLCSTFSGTVNAAQTLLVTNTPKEKHGLVLGTLSSAVWSGNMIGFLLGGFIVHYFGYFWAFMLCGGLFFLGGIFILFFVHENFVPEPKKQNINTKKIKSSSLPTIIWLILFMFIFISMSRRFDEPFIAMQIELVNGIEKVALNTGIISTIAAIGGILSGVFIGYICDKMSPTKLAIPALALASLAILGQAFATNLVMLAICRFFAFLIAGSLEPIFLMFLANNAADNEKGKVFGLSASMRGIGMLIASILGGVIVVNFGVKGTFVTGSIMMMLLIPYTYKVINKLKMKN